jgi:hypothetical protein
VDVALESDDDHYGVTRHREFGDVLGDIALDDGRLNRLSFFECHSAAQVPVGLLRADVRHGFGAVAPRGRHRDPWHDMHQQEMAVDGFCQAPGKCRGGGRPPVRSPTATESGPLRSDREPCPVRQ